MMISEVLDILGSLISALKVYGAKLPAVVHLATVPSGFKPTVEAVEGYEKAVSRFREQSAKSAYRRLTDHFVESLEAFEAGKLLAAVQPLLAILDLLEAMQRDKTITVTPAESKRLVEYRATLHKIMPGNQPELEGAGKGL
ncbi:hypothetical protein [Candidatus Nitrospira bockiana]